MKLGICTGFEHVETKTEEVVFREEVDFLSSLAFVVHPASPSGAIFIDLDGDLAESRKRSASDRLADLVLQVRARSSPGFFTTWCF